MEARRFVSSLLVLAASSAPAVGQRFQWELEDYDSAEYRRKTVSHSKALTEDAEWKPVRESEALAAAAKRFEPAPAVPAAKVGGNLVKNPSFEAGKNHNAQGWGRSVFYGEVELTRVAEGSKHGKQCVMIRSGSGTDAAWHCNVKVQPGSWYRLSGWVRTEGVLQGAGAQLNIHQLGTGALSERVTGTTDWRRVAVEFHSGTLDSVRVNCLFGGWHRTRGTAWFDGIELVQIERESTENPLDPKLFGDRRRETTVLGKELDRTRQFIEKPPQDLRDLAAWLALDLRRAGKSATVSRQELTFAGFAPVWVEVKCKTPQPDGSQELHAEIRPAKVRPKRPVKEKKKAPAGNKGNKGKGKGGKDAKAADPPPPALIARGTLVLNRFVSSSRVDKFDSRLQLDVEVPAGHAALAGTPRVAVDISERWSWLRDGGPEDSVFKARVGEAIRKGARHLRGHQLAKVNLGRLALVVLTLLKAGESPRDPFMRELIDRLRKMNMKNTYDCAVGIMALEAIYAPADERDLLLAGRIAEPVKREPTPEDLATIQRWTDTLLSNVDGSVDSAYLQRWNYTPARRFDNSNTQYAMLGLYTASLCGVKISSTVWFAAANHWLASQEKPKGEAGTLDLTSYREAAQQDEKKRRRRTVASSVKPRGWGYTGANSCTGSMTTAGITGLVICDAALRAMEKGDKKLFGRIREAIDGGFAWLDRNFSVHDNPRAGNKWHYYYLYGLERACEINGTKLLNGKRWYHEGARLLLEQQADDGSWKDLIDTCFAILFLKKAAPPVITGG